MTNQENTPQHTVLVVDDETVNIKLLRAHLSKRGFAVLEAESGVAALEKAQSKPDLILLDVMMPGMDGLQTCERLKQDESTRDIPVIFLSALSETEVKTRGLEVGGVDFISKPFDSRELLARVQTHITLKEQETLIREYANNLEFMVEERTRKLSAAESELQRDFEIQSVIRSLLQFSMDALPLEELLTKTLDGILSLTSFSFLGQGCIFLSKQNGNGERLLSMRAHCNMPEELLTKCNQVEFGQCVCGRAASLGEEVILDNDASEHTLVERHDDAHSHYCEPIKHDNQVLGVINLYLKKGRRPDSKEREFVRAVSNTLARLIVYKQASEQLENSEEQYRTIFENTGTAMAIIDEDRRIVLVNSMFEALSGFRKDELEHKVAAADFVHPEDRAPLQEYYRSIHPNSTESNKPYEFRFTRRSGAVRHVSMTQSGIPGAERNVVSLLDITDKKRAEEQLLHHAFHDPLTGLPNRTFILDELTEALERSATGEEHFFAVMLMDLDRFNLVNESLGHAIGDQLIVSLSHRLKASINAEDILARFGGDEFAILVNGAEGPVQVERLAADILEVVRQPFNLGGQELVNTSSLGIALSTLGYSRAEDLLRDADTALHRAKQRGKARYEIFDRDMHLKAKNLLELVNDMRAALSRDEFFLHYQPIICLKSGVLTGFEALIRWMHPKRGFVSPGLFIPEAEESGLIIPIGKWVLQEALTRIHALQQKFPQTPLMLSVNLSGKQFTQEAVFDDVQHALEISGFEPGNLKLEITESAVMENAEAATEMLNRLKELDIRLSIDDFGTGYSSLSYLHRFPVDMLKIDRSFVMNMDHSGENLEIIRTIVSLAHSLGMEIIAEGVETEEQLMTLKNLGCEYGQGYFFSRPVDEETLLKDELITTSWADVLGV